jgi:hypothetical protein
MISAVFGFLTGRSVATRGEGVDPVMECRIAEALGPEMRMIATADLPTPDARA